MLYTLTTNPAIDMNISSDPISAKKVNRTRNAEYCANGKGINVSYVLNHFNKKSKILGFFGGFSGDYIIEESQKKMIEVLPVMVQETTRINVFLNDSSGEFKFVNEGATVNEDKKQELLKMVKDLEDIKILVISGSLAKGMNDSFYDELLAIAMSKEIKVIIDISSKKLKQLLEYRPYLIKPNDEEILDVFNIEMNDEEDVIDILSLLHSKGAQNILLTLGEKGSYFYNGKNIYFASAKEVTLISSACAGDGALAAFLSIWLEDEKNIEQALKLSAATGANIAESNGLGLLDKIGEYQEEILVRKVM